MPTRRNYRRLTIRFALAASVALILSWPPSPVFAQPPASPQTSLEGTVEVFIEDHVDHHRVHYVLNGGAGRTPLHFVGTPPELQTGQHVRVRGVRQGDGLALTADAVTQTSSAVAALSNTLGAQSTAVILVNFQDKIVEPYTLDSAREVVFSTTSAFDMENSFQQTWLDGDVFGWFTIPMNSTVCDTTTLASLAKKAATNAGATLSAYKRFVYGFPSNACSWWGYGSVGGNPSQAWINGSFQLRVVGHEMGHNLGLYHARSLNCGASPIGSSCTASEYGDTSDIMGGSAGHYSAFNKERLGWLNAGVSPPITTATTSGTYFLEPYETTPNGGVKALKVLKSTDSYGRKTWYYLEARRPAGFDSSYGTGLTGGIVIHTAAEATADSSYELDMTAVTPGYFGDAALPTGQSFVDAAAGVTISVVGASASGATVTISLGSSPLPCTPTAPLVSMSAAQTTWVAPGGNASYLVTVTNSDSSTCPASTFALGALLPAGWSAQVTPASLLLAPGATASASLVVSIPTTAADGTYTVNAAVSNTASALGTATASAPVTVISAVTLGLQTNAATYSARQAVSLTATIAAGGQPITGATVAFVVTKPNGTTVAGSALTNGAGVAVWSFKLGPKDPAGSYTARGSVVVAGVSGTGSVPFTVK